MKNKIITLIVLVALTFLAAIISQSSGFIVAIGILILSVLKFIGVSFSLMELSKGHLFWQGSVIAFLLLFITTIIIIL